MLSPGIVLQQRYRIKRLLARGGMGAVYEAEDGRLGNAAVAIKETFFSEDWLREQFQREAATLARLSHQALPKVTDHFPEGAGLFLVMNFIAGDDLSALLEQHLEEKGEPFEFRQVMEWADRLLDALAYIHGQYPPVIHRDIKPQNLKLTPRGELFLIDFGLAKNATTPTRPGGSIYGFTLEYAPPEQIKSKGTDARSDLYSLGATLYHLATGTLPPDARVREQSVVKHLMPDLLQPAHHINPRIPFAFSATLAKAMALDREQRYQSAQEMREALLQIERAIEAEIAGRERREVERRRLEEEKLKRQEEEARQREEERRKREEEDRQREEERKRREEEDRKREIERQRQREEAARLKALQEEIRKKEEELANLKRLLPYEADTVTIVRQPPDVDREPIVKQPDANERRIDQEKAEPPPVAPAVRRKTPRDELIIIAIAVSILIAILTANYLHLKSVRPEPDPTPTPRVAPEIEMVLVPEGSFLMGSPDNEPERYSYEGPQHRVAVPSFYIGKYEVTQAQWRKVVGLPKVDVDLASNPSYFKGDNLPVEQVSYWDAREFCLRLSRETGRNYRLPSEAEWEYAARAGTTTPFAFGSSLSSEQANFDGNYPYGGAPEGVYRKEPTPVGTFAPNAFNLHDIHGNVWEWCEDYWHDNYNGAPTDGSAWLSGGVSNLRALRGGSWIINGRNCRSAYRYWLAPGDRLNRLGFRVVVSASK